MAASQGQEDEDGGWEAEKEGGEAENRGMDIILEPADFLELSKKNSQYNLAGRANAWKLLFTLTFFLLHCLPPFSFSVLRTLPCCCKRNPG